MERATWWGGFWERLVREKKVLEKASLNFEEMTTILTEVEAGLHSRPLSYIHNAHKPQPLTPLHFFVGKRLTSLPPKTMVSEFTSSNLTKEHAVCRWKY